MRRAFFLLVFLLLTLIQMLAGGRGEYALYKKWSGLSNSRLASMGQNYINGNKANHRKALLCYTIILNRYDESMPDSDKHLVATAYNRAGYIYFYDFQDFAKAYSSYLKAADVSEDINDHDNQAIAYLCLANVYMVCAEHDDNPKSIARAIELYRKSFNISVETKSWGMAINNFINMSSVAYSLDSLQYIKPELQTLSHLKFPTSVKLGDYAHLLYLAMDAVYKHDYQKAFGYFDRQIAIAQHLSSDSKARILSSSIFNKAILYARMGDYSKAVQTMKEVEALARKNGMKDILNNAYHYLSDYCQHVSPVEAGQYRYRYLELSDTLQRQNNLQDVESLHFLNEFQKIDNEMQEMAESRRVTRVGLVFLAFGVAILVVFLLLLHHKNRLLNQSNRELYQKNVALLKQEKLLNDRAKYEGSHLNDSDKEKLLAKIRSVFDNPGEFCSSEFSLARLAELVDSKSKYVSQVINEVYGQSFTNVLTDARIKEACKRLTDTETYGNYTIEAIANSVGFKSRGNFVTNFKRYTGLTPSAYQRMARESSINR